MSDATVPSGTRLRLLIVDDQPLIRRGLAMMLATESDIDVVGQAADGVEAIEMSIALRPDVVVMDLQMPRVSGVVATREITAKLPLTRVVVLTTFDDDTLVFEAIKAGAHAYLLKDATEVDVLETIRAVHRGDSKLSPTIAQKVLTLFRRIAVDGHASTVSLATSPAMPPIGLPAHQYGDENLTDKEERVLALISQGLSNKQIAATVYLAEGTVKNYVSRIMDKLHANSRTELAVRAIGRQV